MDFPSLLQQVVSPNWAPNPELWVWDRPDGSRQGFGGTGWREQPGQHNLLWLALDMATPPAVYEARNNSLFLWVMMYARTTLVGNQTLDELASLCSLERFTAALASTRVPPELQLLRTLAQGRLAHAHT